MSDVRTTKPSCLRHVRESTSDACSNNNINNQYVDVSTQCWIDNYYFCPGFCRWARILLEIYFDEQAQNVMKAYIKLQDAQLFFTL